MSNYLEDLAPLLPEKMGVRWIEDHPCPHLSMEMSERPFWTQIAVGEEHPVFYNALLDLLWEKGMTWYRVRKIAEGFLFVPYGLGFESSKGSTMTEAICKAAKAVLEGK